MKILITGGHLTPALAVIEELRKKHEVLYVGRKYTFEGDSAISLEYQLISKLGIEFYEIKTGRLQRKFTRHTIKSILKMPFGFIAALKILKKVKPDIVLGFGSYISLPIGIAAKSLNIPLIIHEQVLDAGFSNRLLGKFADKICISWDNSGNYFPKEKIVLTGNPLGRSILNLKDARPIDKFVYISGGSSGSHQVNLLVEKNLEKILNEFTVVHQTGDSKQFNDYDRLLGLKKQLPLSLSKKYTLMKFLDTNEAASAISKSSFMIGRSGINTISELLFFRKPAILIPLAFTRSSEQVKNAKYFKELGLGEYYFYEELENNFYEKINLFYKNLSDYKLTEKILVDDPVGKIISVLEDVYAKKSS